MPVHPQVQTILDLLNQLDFTMAGKDPAEVRALMENMPSMAGDLPPTTIEARTLDTDAGPVPVRVYRPEGLGAGAPVLIWIHGGGFVIGSAEGSDPTATILANDAGAVVVSVDYRLAPEHPCPAAIDDCMGAVRWVVAHGDELGVDATRLAVGGDSAGGNLSALVAIACRDEGIPLRLQALVYPVVDLTGSFPSIKENGTGYLLEEADMDWFMGHYLPDQDPKDPTISPYYLDDLSGLAPALVFTAEFDPLRDEGEAYVERLRDAGVEVTARRWDGQIHGFFSFLGIVDDATAATSEVSAAAKAALA